MSDPLSLKVAARFQAAHPPGKSPRAPVKFQPRVKVPDGEEPVDITEVTKEAGSFPRLPKKFEWGTKVRVRDTHGSPKFRGDEGVIDGYVPWGKYYVKLKTNGRSLVDEGDLEEAI